MPQLSALRDRLRNTLHVLRYGVHESPYKPGDRLITTATFGVIGSPVAGTEVEIVRKHVTYCYEVRIIDDAGPPYDNGGLVYADELVTPEEWERLQAIMGKTDAANKRLKEAGYAIE